jgi:hypothetical protein
MDSSTGNLLEINGNDAVATALPLKQNNSNQLSITNGEEVNIDYDSIVNNHTYKDVKEKEVIGLLKLFNKMPTKELEKFWVDKRQDWSKGSFEAVRRILIERRNLIQEDAKLSNPAQYSREDHNIASTELLSCINSYLDPASALSSEDVIKKFSSAGKEGVDVLCRCLNDVFSTRAEMWSLLYVAREINQSEMDVQLISTFERILVECPDIVKGYPKPPAWMPSLRPLLMGGGQYGWDDGTWLRIAHSLAEYLLDIIPQLPADLSAEHAEKLSQAIN